MAYENFIGLRYLMAKQRGRVVSVITLISIAGVTLGVTAMIVVLSVMGGFKQDLKEKILGTRAHMVVRNAGGEPLKDPAEIVEASEEFDEIVGAAPFLDAEVMASSPTNLNGVMLRGIEPSRIGEVSDLDVALRREKAKGKLSNLEHPDRPESELRREGREPPPSLEGALGEPGVGLGGREGRPDAGSEQIGPPLRPKGSGVGDAGGEGESPADAGTSADSSRGRSDPSLPVVAEDETPPGAEGTPGVDGELPPVVSEEPEFGPGEEPELPSIGDDSIEDSGGSVESPAGETSGGEAGEETAEMPPIAEESSEEAASGGADMPPVDREGPGGEGKSRSELPGVLIGKELAKSLKVGLGDELNLVTPQGEMGPTGPIPRSRPFRVVGIFYTGMYEYDANHAYTSLEETRDFLDQQGVSGVELKVESVDRAISVANALEDALPDRYEVRDWKEMNRSLFYALKLEKIAMFVVLTFIILVASFSIIAMLIMIVLEKKRDISVLKSMGVTDGGIMRIFMYQGVVIGTVGALLGLLSGLGICYLLIEFGWPLNSQVYYISTLPVDVDPVEVMLVVSATVFISFVATIYPSWKAAQLTPVEGLRYE